MEWEIVRQFAFFVTLLLMGYFQIPQIVDWVKHHFELSGNSVKVLVFALSLLLTASVMILDGSISQDTIMSGNFPTVFLNVLALSQVRYLRVKKEVLDEELRSILQSSETRASPFKSFADDN